MSESNGDGGKPPLFNSKTPGTELNPNANANGGGEGHSEPQANNNEDPNVQALSDPSVNPNPLGISPPGMRLRSGLKKKPTPMKMSKTPGKRMRDDSDDDDHNGSQAGKFSKRRALATAFEEVEDSRKHNDDTIMNTTKENVQEKGMEIEIDDAENLSHHDKDQQKDNKGAPNSEIIMSAENEKEKYDSSTLSEAPNANDKIQEKDTLQVEEVNDVVMTTEENKEKDIASASHAVESNDNAANKEKDKEEKSHDVVMTAEVDTNNYDKNKRSDNQGTCTPISIEVTSVLEKEVNFIETNAEISAISNDVSLNTTTPSTARSLGESFVSPTVNLRLPSQHTPAPQKLDATYKGNTLLRDFMTPAKPSLGNNGIAANEDPNINGIVSNGGTDSEIEKLELRPMKPVEVEEEEEEREDGRRDGLFHYIKRKYILHFDSVVNMVKETDARDVGVNDVTFGLVGILVVLHIALVFTSGGLFAPFWVWNDVSGIANRTLGTYRNMGILRQPPVVEKTAPILVEELIENIVLVDNKVLVDEEMDILRKRRKIEQWKMQKIEATKFVEDYRQQVDDEMGVGALLQSDLDDETLESQARLTKLKKWEQVLEQSRIVVENGGDNVGSIIKELVGVSELPLNDESMKLLSFDGVSIPGEECNGEDFILELGGSDVKYISEDTLFEALDNMQSYTATTYSEIRSNEKLLEPMQDWMQHEVDKLSTKNSFDEVLNVGHIAISSFKRDKVNSINNPGLSPKVIRALIDERVEVGKADKLGKHDYASIRSGASIIHTGSRQTSSSLIDNLPLGNQLVAKLGLKFYGHGPDAALEPTFPKGSLGQCWSFETEGERSKIAIREWARSEDEFENEPDRGESATLAVKLAKPIYLDSVVIEHAPVEVLKNRSTAIRRFRVIGFQNNDASGEPWILGTFEYNSNKDEHLQEFEVDSKLENGMPIPKLGSVVLAIDSNWGAEYSCLYRFRIHGHNKFKG